MRRESVAVAGAALLAGAYAAWATLGLFDSLDVTAVLAVEAGGFVLIAVALARDRAVLAAWGSLLVVAGEVGMAARFLAFLGPVGQAIFAAGVIGAVLLAVGAWRRVRAGGTSVRALLPGAAVMGGAFFIDFASNAVAGDWFLARGFVFAVPGWALVLWALTSGATTAGAPRSGSARLDPPGTS